MESKSFELEVFENGDVSIKNPEGEVQEVVSTLSDDEMGEAFKLFGLIGKEIENILVDLGFYEDRNAR